jgi:hypothetical protein
MMTGEFAMTQNVPHGRLLYRPGEGARYVVVKNAARPGLWLVEDGWTVGSEAAGPFRDSEALRALRLSNTMVPQGCERGPWQDGLGLFKRTRLPGHPNDWSRLEIAWLEPSVALYEGADLERVSNETCCSPPRNEPRVDWAVSLENRAAWRQLVSSRRPDHRADRDEVGVLVRPWNAHPDGAPVLAADRSLSAGFVIVDLPPTGPHQ